MQIEARRSGMIWAALILVSFIFGSNYLAIRIIAAHIPPLFFQGIRFFGAGCILFLLAAAGGGLKIQRPSRSQWQASCFIGFVMLVIGQGGVAWSEQYIASGLAALIIATIPLWVVLLSRYMLGAKLTVRKILGLLCGFVGLVPILHIDGPVGNRFSVIAVLLVAALGWAVGSVYAKRASLHANISVAISMQMICGGIGLLCSSVIFKEWRYFSLSAYTASVLYALAYLTLVGGVLAYAAFGWLLRTAPPAVTSMFAYISPVVAVLLGARFLNERITENMLIGGSIIVLGVMLVMTATADNGPSRLAQKDAEA